MSPSPEQAWKAADWLVSSTCTSVPWPRPQRAPFSSKFDFFGVLPGWQDVDGTCAEIDFLFAEQKLCNGVGAYTSYGDKLPGHESFRPIWEKLQGYGALVFMHPTSLDLRPRYIGGFLPQPIVDYPLATTRAAVDLVFAGTMRSCPGVDVILSHAGGALPFIAFAEH